LFIKNILIVFQLIANIKMIYIFQLKIAPKPPTWRLFFCDLEEKRRVSMPENTPPPLAETLAVFLGEGVNTKKGQKKGPKCEKRKKEDRLNINRKCKGKINAKLRHSCV
jgi:hypothetical protein